MSAPLPSGCDYLIVGGGVVGITIALELRRRFPGSKIVLIEKEPGLGAHASGRNSGVLHAGFYYSADSLKARFCREGNAAMHAYVKEKNLSINACGKLVVAKGEGELKGLDELHRRGTANGVKLEMISEAEAKKIEPRVKTFQRALWSPTTSSVNPHEVMESFERDAVAANVHVVKGVAYEGREKTGVRTSAGVIDAGYVINCAGLYADKIAKDYGFCKDYTILPFKGLYLYSSEAPGALRAHIYPVPDLRFPFLGVHFTVTVDKHPKIGPTAIPAFWREHYGGLKNFSLSEFAHVVGTEASLFLSANFNFRGLAREEIKKYSRSYLVGQAGLLLDGVKKSDYTKWGTPGIRAQLLNVKERKLEMDFILEGDAKSLHVLNAVSPAFTCAIPFSQHVCDNAQKFRA